MASGATSSILTTRFQRFQKRQKRIKYVSDEIMAGNFPKLKKETYPGRSSIESPIPNEMNSETHTKTSHNQQGKSYR